MHDFITKQTYVVITRFCRNMGYVASMRFCRESSFSRIRAVWGLFCPDFYSDTEDFSHDRKLAAGTSVNQCKMAQYPTNVYFRREDD